MRFSAFTILLLIMGFALADMYDNNLTGPGGKSNTSFILPPDPVTPRPCNTSYSDTVNVRALDGRLRPMEDAAVSIRYQLDSSTGRGYFTSPKRLTGKDGNYSFDVKNIEQYSDSLDCGIAVSLSFAGMNFSQTVIAQNHPDFIDFNLNAYYLTIIVVDQNNNPINGATIFIDQRNKTTINGFANFRVFKGDNRFFVRYLEGKQEQVVKVNDDFTSTVQLIFYKLKMDVTDDKENPLKAKIIIDDKEYGTDNKGELSIDKLVGQYHVATIVYGQKQKVVDLDLASNSQYNIAFDNSPPEINKIDVVEEGNKIKLIINAADPGKFASGFSVADVSVKYITESGETKKAIAYSGKPHEYIAEIPIGKDLAELDFFVDITDKEGNKVSAEGRHKLKSQTTLNNTSSVNISNNKAADNQINAPKNSLPLYYIIGGIIILLIVFYAVYRLKFRKEE